MNLYNFIIKYICTEYPKDNLKNSAIVFSPHFDDETLGCGGTIIKKKRVGADVKIVFMTDGGKSHNHLMAEDRLKAIRKCESLAVSHSLGLAENDLFFLDFEETKLCNHISSAITKVLELLSNEQPTEIFVPYHREPTLWSLDHLVTNRIALSALQKYGKRVTIYEYPIWLWYCQPWLTPIKNPNKIVSFFKQNIISRLNLLTDFRSSVYIGDVLKYKRGAMDLYTSQMSRIVSDLRWQTLSDVSNGRFLKCFFHEYEIFSQRTFN